MGKVYAVRKGRKTGIFNEWKDCKESIFGYSGAEYKSFPSYQEAVDYLNGKTSNYLDINFSDVDIKKMIADTETVVAFVDGSYDSEKNRYSFGLVALGLGKVHEDSCYDFEPMHIGSKNVAGELLGAQTAMEYCLDNNIHNLRLFYDYEGIAKWALGDWKAEKLGPREYKQFYNSIKDKLNVEFYKVPAHFGIYYNERADELAKQALGLA